MFSASDVSNFLACHHLSTLDRAEAAGQIDKPFFRDLSTELLQELGARHEHSYLQHLIDQGLDVAKIPTDIPWAESTTETVDAMRRKTSVIYQATFQSGPWHGRSDFLIKVDKSSSLGAWSYEPLETKLARSTKAGALVQLCFYADLLSQIQGVLPDSVSTVLGNTTKPEAYPLGQYIAYFRRIKRDFEAAYGKMPNTYPEPVEHCNVCSWFSVCNKRLHEDDHLSIVPGTTRNQRKVLADNGVPTVASLATFDFVKKPKLEGIGSAALTRIQKQAQIQVNGRKQNRLICELLEPIEPNIGLAAIPAPSPGDLFLDLEGDSFAFGTGLEYLMGILSAPEQTGSELLYQALWSFDRANEKEAFREFITQVVECRKKFPEMHVYHYAAYEPTQIKRMAAQHGICIDEVDQLLKARIFVDLYRIVRQGMRASVESYSIKSVEALYDFKRSAPARESVVALQTFAGVLALGSPRDAPSEILRAIETYNRDDCFSIWHLREWLEERRRELEARTRTTLPRPTIEQEEEEELSPQVQETRALMQRLTSGLPPNETKWNAEHRALWLLAQMLEYRRREDKSSWWEYFRLCDLSDDELLEDKSALSGLKYVGAVGKIKNSIVHQYSFPPQDHTIDRAFEVHDPKTRAGAGEVFELNDASGTIDLKRGNKSRVPHPTTLIPQNVLRARDQRNSLVRLGQWIVENGISGLGPFQAARDLLLRRPPRISLPDLGDMFDATKKMTAGALREIRSLSEQPSILPIQGPPGSGKSYTGAKMVAELVQCGKRIGITAVSHKVISNMLQYACTEARANQKVLSAVQKGNGKDDCTDRMVRQVEDNKDILNALQNGSANVAAGTPWLWARSDMADSVDVLFVDEAGQMSLADVLAISQVAKSVVLLGDPQQLNQPQKGVHPPGVELSALAYLLDGRATIESGKGLFLKETWRLHPEICAFTSELFYDGRLNARLENRNQRLNTTGPLNGTGLRYIPVQHSGNQSESREEVEKVSELVKDLLDKKATWTNKTGRQDIVQLGDILVVAPYNAQVSALSKVLPVDARVGTVDKFQGQQAPVVIYSMTTSTPEDAPHGMEFLYSLNRLNVAISRAQCIAVIVASPALFQVECKTPRQIQLANALCRYLELAQ